MTVLQIHTDKGTNNGTHIRPCENSLTPALTYHAHPMPGKYATVPTKKLSGASDLALAYSPGVADACHVIAENPAAALQYTMRQHLVAVISNGTAVLGLGNIGPLASKPVMEGKAVLFQMFSGLNAIDLEINQQDPEKLVDIIASLAPTFGAINLEDIKSPECFYIESALKERLDIPVFHDDQHGTAITVSAALINALALVDKTLENSRCVVAGAGAGALACVQLLIDLGMNPAHITVCDTKGVVHTGRSNLSDVKKKYAIETHNRSLGDALKDADIFLGLSGPETVTPEMIQYMASQPIIFALANPIPEIWPKDVLRVKPDAYVGTGRSDLPNQINNVLCFPYIFRGAMDVEAKTISLNMKKACVRALSGLAQRGFVDLNGAYDGEMQEFGPKYFVPKPFDVRLGVALPLAVAAAAVQDMGDKTFDLDHYKACLIQRAYRDFLIFKGVYSHSCFDKGPLPKVGYIIETEDGKIPQSVLAAARTLKDSGVALPYFVGQKETLGQQLCHDAVFSDAVVYALDAYNLNNGMNNVHHNAPSDRTDRGRDQARSVMRVVSDRKTITPCVQGFYYKDALHFYAPQEPCGTMVQMLTRLGCIFQGHTSLGTQDVKTLAHQGQGHPHFGGLKAHHTIPAYWHTSAVPDLFKQERACFGPIALDIHQPIKIDAGDDSNRALEKSSWAILMQEKTV